MASSPGILNFPTTLDDVISLVEANNNVSETLSAGINNSVLLIPVTNISKFSASGYVTILDVVPNPTKIEIVAYTSKSGSDLVVPASNGRAQGGTSAQSFLAGAVVEQRPTARHWGVLRDAIIEIEKKIGYSAAVIRPLDPSGTDQAGANIDITGGAGTGAAIPGIFGVRYPVIGASGATVQSLSSNRYPPSTVLFTNTTSGTAVVNTTTETSLFTGAGLSAGSTLSIEGGVSRVGTIFPLKIIGVYGATAGPTGRIRIKAGATTLADTNTFTVPNSGGGVFKIECELLITAIGVGGSISVGMLRGEFAAGGGAQTPTIAYASGSQSVDVGNAKVIDVTFQWGTAAAGNSIQLTQAMIRRFK